MVDQKSEVEFRSLSCCGKLLFI